MKKNIRFAIALLFFTFTLYSQTKPIPIAVGDVFVVGAVENYNYTYINFPKPNIIIKKGGLVNFKNVVGKKVVVTSIKEKKNGTLVATIQLASKRLFFKSHKTVTVKINKALQHKELLRLKTS